MINLQQRSYQKELMDESDIPFAAITQTLKELNIINTWLGGHAITISGVEQIKKKQWANNYMRDWMWWRRQSICHR